VLQAFIRTANLAAGTSDRHADSASHTDYTRKNDDSGRKRQGTEPASHPSSIVLIMKAFYWTRFLDANRTTLR
jgi:hypothetical protein